MDVLSRMEIRDEERQRTRDMDKNGGNLWIISLERMQCGQLPKENRKSFPSLRITEHDKRHKNQFSIFASSPILAGFVVVALCVRLWGHPNAYNRLMIVHKPSDNKSTSNNWSSSQTSFTTKFVVWDACGCEWAIWIRLSITSIVIICLGVSLISVARLCLAS